MPIYEYICDECGHQKEVFHGMNDNPLTNCNECGKSTLRKLVSASGFRLKGSGWYETDFKKDEKKKNLSTVDDNSSSKESSADKKEEGSSKTETGVEAKSDKPENKVKAENPPVKSNTTKSDEK